MVRHRQSMETRRQSILSEIRRWTWIGAASGAGASLCIVLLGKWLIEDFGRTEEAALGWDQRFNGVKNGALWLMFAACGALAKSKGRSAWYGLLGAFSCMGLAVIMLVPKRCLECGEKGGLAANACTKCGAPLSLRWRPRPEFGPGPDPTDPPSGPSRG